MGAVFFFHFQYRCCRGLAALKAHGDPVDRVTGQLPVGTDPDLEMILGLAQRIDMPARVDDHGRPALVFPADLLCDLRRKAAAVQYISFPVHDQRAADGYDKIRAQEVPGRIQDAVRRPARADPEKAPSFLKEKDLKDVLRVEPLLRIVKI